MIRRVFTYFKNEIKAIRNGKAFVFFVYLTGGFRENSISFNGVTIPNPYAPVPAMYLVKFNPYNNVVWHKTMGSYGSGAWGYSIAMAQCGIIWVSGVFRDSVYIDGRTLLPPPASVADTIFNNDPIFIAGFTSFGSYVNSSALSSGGDDQNGIACDGEGNVFMCSDYWCTSHVVIGEDMLPVSYLNELFFVAKFGNQSPAGNNFQHFERTVCRDSSKIMSAASGYSYYLWSDGQQGLTHAVKDTGLFWVTGLDSCHVAAIDTFYVSSTCDCSNSLFVPNTFTPNGDGENDVFYPRCGSEIDQITSFRIYNRWGELIFEKQNVVPNDISSAWDGSYKDKLPLPEVFVYVTDAICKNGAKINKKGSVTIVR